VYLAPSLDPLLAKDGFWKLKVKRAIIAISSDADELFIKILFRG
jgi:hypothetical protein